MATVEHLFRQALRRAFGVAKRHGLADGNADMVATDAAETAWLDAHGTGEFGDMINSAIRHAHRMSRGERYGYRRWLSIADEWDDDSNSVSVRIGEAPNQEERLDGRLRLAAVQETASKLSGTDREVLTLMLTGLGVMEIAKAVGRAVPLLVSDVGRIRETLHREAAE